MACMITHDTAPATLHENIVRAVRILIKLGALKNQPDGQSGRRHELSLAAHGSFHFAQMIPRLERLTFVTQTLATSDTQQ